MNEVGAEPLIVMAEPDLNPSEEFALAPRGSDLEFEQGSQRKIIHVDMDAFYASVEQRDNPALRNKPVAVGGSRARGVVAAASYEARKFGVRSAMPSVTARRKCPDLIFVEPRFDVYKKVSLQIQAIFAEHTAIIEPLSLDEAYLDVTENLQGIASATEIAEQIKAKIRAETQLTASAGVSYNKFLAKLASDHRKPDGLFVITPEMGPSFIEALAVERFHGVGPATAAKMKKLGIITARDLRAKDEAFLLQYFGKAGRHFYWICRGIDHRPVLPNRIRKSIGAENTFSRDLTSLDDMRAELDPLVDKVWHYCESIGVRGRTVTLKVKFANFQIISRSRSYIAPISDRSTLASISEELLAAQFPMRKGVRLLGVSLSSLCADAGDVDPQMTLAL
jgi:DNA polymerase IV